MNNCDLVNTHLYLHLILFLELKFLVGLLNWIAATFSSSTGWAFLGFVLVEAKGFTTAVLLLKSLASPIVLASIKDFLFLLVSWGCIYERFRPFRSKKNKLTCVMKILVLLLTISSTTLMLSLDHSWSFSLFSVNTTRMGSVPLTFGPPCHLESNYLAVFFSPGILPENMFEAGRRFYIPILL